MSNEQNFALSIKDDDVKELSAKTVGEFLDIQPILIEKQCIVITFRYLENVEFQRTVTSYTNPSLFRKLLRLYFERKNRTLC